MFVDRDFSFTNIVLTIVIYLFNLIFRKSLKLANKVILF